MCNANENKTNFLRFSSVTSIVSIVSVINSTCHYTSYLNTIVSEGHYTTFKTEANYMLKQFRNSQTNNTILHRFESLRYRSAVPYR